MEPSDRLASLFLKKLAGEITEPERKELLSLLLSCSEEERQDYAYIEQYWYEQRPSGDVSKQMKDKIAQHIGQPSKPRRKSILKRWIPILVAASVAILLFIGINQYNLVQQPSPSEIAAQNALVEKYNEAGKKSMIKLSDGSVVYLNSESKLTIPQNFSENHRTVTLEGEAYFQVAKDSLRPFMVKTQNAKVMVLGTEFNLNSYADNDGVTLMVHEGRVSFSNNAAEQSITLVEEQAAILDKESLSISITEYDLDALAWKENEIIFKSANFSQIVQQLERWYGVKFEVKADIADRKKSFTGRYKDMSLEEVLEGVGYSLDFDYRIEGKKVTIY